VFNRVKAFRSRRSLLAVGLSVLVLVVVIGIYLMSEVLAPSWSEVDRWIALRYADVPSISTEELDVRMRAESAHSIHQKTLLLDIREASEYAISRLPGARNVPPATVVQYAAEALAGLDRSQSIVAYCAVGVRSAEAVQTLQAHGFINVRNLKGSIFQWANEGRALEGQRVVHPYSASWGELLNAERRAVPIDVPP
jgi:rhodanese-related sulfurtransferase